jgi:hypothetical protein
VIQISIANPNPDSRIQYEALKLLNTLGGETASMKTCIELRSKGRKKNNKISQIGGVILTDGSAPVGGEEGQSHLLRGYRGGPKSKPRSHDTWMSIFNYINITINNYCRPQQILRVFLFFLCPRRKSHLLLNLVNGFGFFRAGDGCSNQKCLLKLKNFNR